MENLRRVSFSWKTNAEGRMRFDARAAAKLPSGEHLTFEGFPGLRLHALTSRKSWTYRYKSPVDGRMRQVKLGAWPAMSFAAAIAAWEANRVERDSGAELSAMRRKREKETVRPSPGDYTVEQLCRDYLRGHVEVNRKAKGGGRGRAYIQGDVGTYRWYARGGRHTRSGF
ncbi:hypothetical protein QFZ97_006124 [Paraburkholderia youngii]